MCLTVAYYCIICNVSLFIVAQSRGEGRMGAYVLSHPTQLNPKLGKPYFPMQKPHQNHSRPSLFLSSYTTKLDQIQYATLFQPN